MVGYYSEPFWTASTISTVLGILLGLLLAVIGACLPGLFYYRRRPEERGKAIKYAVMGGIGSIIFVPWIMAIAGAVKEPPSEAQRKKCRLSHPAWILFGVLVLGFGIFLLIALLRHPVWTFQTVYRVAYFLAAGVVLLLPFTSRGGRFWACNLAAPYLLVCCANYTYANMGAFYAIMKLILLAGAVFVFAELLRAVGSEAERPSTVAQFVSERRAVHRENRRQDSIPTVQMPSPPPSRQTAPVAPSGDRSPAKKLLLCTDGQYSGCQFPLRDGETLCLGSDPALAHLVFTGGGIAPLHLEITFQSAQNQYLVAVPSGSHVYLGNALLPEISMVSIGEEISFGIPAQRFRLL